MGGCEGDDLGRARGLSPKLSASQSAGADGSSADTNRERPQRRRIVASSGLGSVTPFQHQPIARNRCVQVPPLRVDVTASFRLFRGDSDGPGGIESASTVSYVDALSDSREKARVRPRGRTVWWVGEFSIPSETSVAGGGNETLSFARPWDDAVLWGPNGPQLYKLRVTINVDGKVRDVRRERFGFRQFGIDGRHFTLNGERFHVYGSCHQNLRLMNRPQLSFVETS